jgi:hypothetical protein
MVTRPPGTLALAALLVLAGCGGFASNAPGVGEPSPSFTPAPVPDAPAAHPPGITAERVVDPARLADAHVRSIEGVSYSLRSNRSTYYPNGTLRSRIDIDLRLSRNRSHVAVVRTAGPEGSVIIGPPPASAVYWSNQSLYASRVGHDGDSIYSILDDSANPIATWNYWTTTAAFGGPDGHPSVRYADFFGSIPTTVVDNWTVNGTTLYQVRGRRPASPAFTVDEVDAVGPAGSGPALQATVTEDGLVRSLQLRYRAFDDGEEYTVDWRIRYRAVGNTTVSEPSWLDRAVAENRNLRRENDR